MKEKICIFKAEGDVSNISVDVCDALVMILRAEDGALSVTMPEAKNVHAACDGKTLYVSQTKCPFRPFAKRQQIVINVPGHIVPSVLFNGKRGDLKTDGGIYGDIAVTDESGTVAIYNTDAETLTVNGDRIKTDIADSTFRGRIYVNAGNVSFLTQHAYAGVVVVRSKKGNMGIVALNTRDCTLETEEGNITATLVGRKQDFDLNLVANGKPAEQSGDKEVRAKKRMCAFTKKGNITCDFVEDDGAADEIEDKAAFAEEVAREEVAVDSSADKEN